MSSCPALNCAAALANPPQLKPNPDVSGIGILVGFLATAYFAWILLVVHYVLVFDPSDAGLKAEGESEGSAEGGDHPTNPIDKALLDLVSKWFERPQDTWKDALERLLLIMSDQQMITVIALLGSGFSQLKCGISAYHWQITIYLVWFSSFTHLATLTFLRRYLRENVPLRSWRLGLMTTLIASLVVALIPTGNLAWLTDTDYAGIPAWCLFNYSADDPPDPSSSGGGDGGSMELSIFVLVFSYATRAIKMFQWSSARSRLYLRTKPGKAIKKHLDKLHTGSRNTRTKKWIFLVPYYIILSILLVARSWLDLFESMMFEITWLLIALLWGTLRLFGTRNTTMGNGNILDENFWAFGQALATAMLGLLVFSAIETYIETRRKMKGNANSNGTSPSDDASTKSPEGPVHGSGALQSSPTNHSNTALQTSDASEARQIIPMDRDIANESTVATRTRNPPQAPPRSWTAFSTEERTTGEQNIHLKVNIHTLPEDSSVGESTAPHKANYNKKSWYNMLAMFHYLQLLSVSGGILTGAYNTNSNSPNFSGLFGSDKDVFSIFLHLLNWLTVYAPLSSFIMTLPYTLPPKVPAIFRSWLLLPRLRRGWVVTKQVIIFGIAEFFSVDTLIGHPIGLPWETILAVRQFLPLLVLSGVVVVYAPWYMIISHKLRRET